MTFFKTTLFILLISFTTKGAAQVYPTFMTDSRDFVEKVKMTTDRDVYFVDEELFFEGAVESTYPEWSKIIYTEIISYNGKVLYQSKHKVNKSNGVKGAIKLPDDIITGYYYLRGYTKWMRNYSAYNYFYKPILIVNSNKTKVLSVSDSYTSIGAIDTLGENYSISQNLKSKHSTFFKNRHIDLQDHNLDSCSISMVREELVNNYALGIKRENDSIFNYQYLPELKGLTVTGKIVSDSLESTQEEATVFLSILDKTPYSSVMYTDQWGKFFFNINDYYGHKELMISINSKDESRINFQIDNDFCNREIKLPFISPLTIAEEQWEKLHMPNTNAQVEMQIIKTEEKKHISNFEKQAFYTSPTLRINMDDYISMPTLEDYIYELIPMLGIRYHDETPRIIIRNSENTIDVRNYNTLIIYDGLFIHDVKSLINISPEKLDYIEVFNQVYILGDNVFGGVVNVVSKNKSISNLELSDDGLFIDYLMLDDNNTNERFPQSLKKQEPLNNNTVMWSSDTDKKNKNHLLVPDREGSYLLIYSKWEKNKLMRNAIKLEVE